MATIGVDLVDMVVLLRNPVQRLPQRAVGLQEEYREILAREDAAAWRTDADTGFKQFAISWLLSSLCAIPPS